MLQVLAYAEVSAECCRIILLRKNADALSAKIYTSFIVLLLIETGVATDLTVPKYYNKFRLKDKVKRIEQSYQERVPNVVLSMPL